MPNGATNAFSRRRRTSCPQPLNNAALNGESLVGDLPGMGEIGFSDQDRLGTQASKLYHMGFREPVRRSTLADANETRDWRIYAEFAQRLIAQARK